LPDDIITNAYKSADIVFTGRVIAIDTVLISDSANVISESNTKPHLEVTIRKFVQVKFLIARRLKSKNKNSYVIILTDAVGTRCGFEFILNADYVVYAYKEHFGLIHDRQRMKTRNEFRYSTSSCTRTTLGIKSEIKALKESKLIG
jgi:hypothetical protein